MLLRKIHRSLNASKVVVADLMIILLAVFVSISDVKPEFEIKLPNSLYSNKDFTLVAYNKSKSDVFIYKDNQWQNGKVPRGVLLDTTEKGNYGLKPPKSGYMVKGLLFGDSMNDFTYKYTLLGKDIKKLIYEL